MADWSEKARTFAALHVPGDPVILYNCWDAGSALAVTRAGAKAVATGSFGVAGAHGIGDGEKLPFDLVIANLERTVAVTELPVTVDLEAGYGATPADVGASVARAKAAGAVGINIEDKSPATRAMFGIEEQCERIAAAAATGIFVNARCDLFILAKPEEKTLALVDAVIERAHAYKAAGASGLFAPFLEDAALIEPLCRSSPLPVNILKRADCPDHKTLASLGVARISHGHGPWAEAMAAYEAAARAIYR